MRSECGAETEAGFRLVLAWTPVPGHQPIRVVLDANAPASPEKPTLQYFYCLAADQGGGEGVGDAGVTEGRVLRKLCPVWWGLQTSLSGPRILSDPRGLICSPD